MDRVVYFRSFGVPKVVMASTEDDLSQVAVKIVEERFNLNLYGDEPTAPNLPSFKQSDVKKVEIPELREFAKTFLSDYNAKKKMYDTNLLEHNTIQEAITNKDGKFCLNLLDSHRKRHGHEFEIYEVTTL